LIRMDKPTVMTRHLMDILFTREEMARSSIVWVVWTDSCRLLSYHMLMLITVLVREKLP